MLCKVAADIISKNEVILGVLSSEKSRLRFAIFSTLVNMYEKSVACRGTSISGIFS